MRRAAALSALVVATLRWRQRDRGRGRAAARRDLHPDPRAAARAAGGCWAGGRLFTSLATAWWWLPLLLLGRYSLPFLDYIENATITTVPTDMARTLVGESDWVAYFAGIDFQAGHQLVSTAVPHARRGRRRGARAGRHRAARTTRSGGS